MPYINLGNIINTSDGASLYNYTYYPGTHTHVFEGNTLFGYCKCTHTYTLNDPIKVNNTIIDFVNKPTLIKANAQIYFIIEENKMYIFDKAEQFDIPDGSLVEPINDPSIWCSCAGINWYEIGCPTIETLAASENYCSQLFNSENAFAYYRRSDKIIKKTILNTNVISCIENLNYFTTQYLRDNNGTNGYIVSTNTELYDGYLYGAFSTIARYRTTEVIHTGHWVQIEMAEPIWPYKFVIIPESQNLIANSIFKWQASNDGTHWIDLDTKNSSSTTGTIQTFYNTTGANNKYKYFRIYVWQNLTKGYWSLYQGQISGIK